MTDEDTNLYRMVDLIEEDRPREKLLRNGRQSLSDAELLALLVGKGIPGQNALHLSTNILSCFKNTVELMDIELEELMKIKGIGLGIASRIIAGLELGRRISIKSAYRQVTIKNPESVSKLFMEELRYEQREFFCVVLLDTKNKVIGKETISVGNLNSSLVHPREVFRPAVQRSANAIILVHNHPSGDPAPSQEDIKITKRLEEVGLLMGIQVLDHIIIGDNSYTSFKEKLLIS